MKIWLVFLVLFFSHSLYGFQYCLRCPQLMAFMCLDPYLATLTSASSHNHPLSHAPALPWSPMKLGPSSETSATISAWPWRKKMLKSTRNCLPWFLLIYICLTLWLMEPVSLSRPWRRADTHFTGEMRWDGFDWLADCHWVTGASLNCLCTVGEIYFVCE